MKKPDQIIEQFRSRSLRPYGVIVLTADDAVEMVIQAQAAGLAVLGVDSFRIHNDGGIQPFSEHSIDYSDKGLSADSSCKQAIAFIRDKAVLGFLFEVVLADNSANEQALA